MSNRNRSPKTIISTLAELGAEIGISESDFCGTVKFTEPVHALSARAEVEQS